MNLRANPSVRNNHMLPSEAVKRVAHFLVGGFAPHKIHIWKSYKPGHWSMICMSCGYGELFPSWELSRDIAVYHMEVEHGANQHAT